MISRMHKLRSHGVGELFSVSISRYVLHYSTSTTADQLCKTHFMVDYLINSLGLSREEAISASTKVTHIKSTENPDLVLNFFKQSGLDKTQIRDIVYSVPTLLTSAVDKTLKPKFKVLHDLGLTGSDLVKVISGNQSLFSRGLDTHIIPSVDYLKKVLSSEENVVKAIKKSKWLLSYNISKTMPPNLLLLQKCGFSNEKIEKFILINPRNVMQKPEWLEDIVHRVEVELGIPRESAMFFHGIDALASISKSTLEVKFGIFRSFGWSDSDIISMARKLPFCLSMSEAKIRKGLNFFMKELGYAPGYLASHPKLLKHSLEKRVVPRNEVLKILKEKKLIRAKPSLYSVVCLTELKFVEEFVHRCEDEVPGLYEAYINKNGL